MNDTPTFTDVHLGLPLLAALLAGLYWQSVAAALVVALLVALGIVGHVYGWWVRLWDWSRPRLQAFWYWLRHRNKIIERDLYHVYLGYSLITGQDVIANIKQMMGIGLWTVTGGGKSSFLHLLISQLVSNHSAEQVQFAISDLKEIEFSIWDSLPHLFCPIAFTVEEADEMMRLVMAEKERRARLFRLVSSGRVKRVCNNLDRYLALKRQLRLDLPDLPILYVIFDETSVFTRSTVAENNLITLAEQGRAYGIFPVCATQDPTAVSIPPTVRRQLLSRFVGGMPASAYQYADVPKEVHKEYAKPGPGQFFASIGSSGSDYDLIQTPYVKPEEIEAIANALSRGRVPPAWPQNVETGAPDAPPQWGGSDEEKRQLLITWFNELQRAGQKPTPAKFQRRFNVKSAQTYYNYDVRGFWQEYLS